MRPSRFCLQIFNRDKVYVGSLAKKIQSKAPFVVISRFDNVYSNASAFESSVNTVKTLKGEPDRLVIFMFN